MELLEQVISKFAETEEGTGLRNTEAACALFMVAGFIADTQIVDHQATRKKERGEAERTDFGRRFRKLCRNRKT